MKVSGGIEISLLNRSQELCLLYFNVVIAETNAQSIKYALYEPNATFSSVLAKWRAILRVCCNQFSSGTLDFEDLAELIEERVIGFCELAIFTFRKDERWVDFLQGDSHIERLEIYLGVDVIDLCAELCDQFPEPIFICFPTAHQSLCFSDVEQRLQS